MECRWFESTRPGQISGEKMKTTYKVLAVLGSLWPAYKLFTLSTGLAAAIASIPVLRTIDALVDLPPVAAKITGFLVIGGLLVVSWYIAEAVVLLAAIAIAGEVEDLIERIKVANANRPQVEKARESFSCQRPYFAEIEA